MKKVLVIFAVLTLASPLWAAITERYVTTTGTDTYANSTNSATPMSLSTAISNAVAGDRINIKSGTYTRTASDTFSTAGSATSPIIWRGYNTTIGDGDLGRTNANGALITTNMPLISYNSTFHWLSTTGSFRIWESIQFSGTYSVASQGVISLGADDTMRSCVITNISTGSSARVIFSGNNRLLLLNCDLSSAGGSSVDAIDIQGTGLIHGCRIIGTSKVGDGVRGGVSTTFTVSNCTITGFANGINQNNTTASLISIGNTIVNNTTGINIVSATTTNQTIINNMITDNTTGISAGGVNIASRLSNNRYRDNTTNIGSNISADWVSATDYNKITSGSGTTADYVDYAGNDFRLISTSPAKATGTPLYLDIGALQRREPQGGFFLP